MSVLNSTKVRLPDVDTLLRLADPIAKGLGSAVLNLGGKEVEAGQLVRELRQYQVPEKAIPAFIKIALAGDEAKSVRDAALLYHKVTSILG